ncbi:sucrase ferredoxin [Pseudonocardia ailaonensis]|uniref:Sucrase ferredoxin n=1 Tax=Pseudonocardia ailaonensis TaxID=367279 RepID=A0ABN2NBX9_9PSEU
MASGTDARCTALARAAEEPLPGTAPVRSRLLLVEHVGSWPRAVDRHQDPAIAGLADRARAAGRKLLLIRRPGRRPSSEAPRTVFLADTGPGECRVRRFVIDGPDELPAVPLGDPHAGERIDQALLMVCTHGTRDLCCAVEGRSLATAVVEAEPEPDVVWECSHLGGHRFAPTALVLPTGYLYGRLDVATAVAARKAAAQGEMEPGLCRGRAAWEPAGQVAELAVRVRTGLRDADALTIDRIDEVRRGREVLVRGPEGAAWAVLVVERPGPSRPLSCGAALERSAPLVAMAVRAVAHA